VGTDGDSENSTSDSEDSVSIGKLVKEQKKNTKILGRDKEPPIKRKKKRRRIERVNRIESSSDESVNEDSSRKKTDDVRLENDKSADPDDVIDVESGDESPLEMDVYDVKTEKPENKGALHYR